MAQQIFYYDAKRTYNTKFEVITECSDFSKVRFYFYDEIYSNLDWSKTPTHNLKQLYKERAQQIRDEYDYVVIAYSGGIDSTNILETFYYNDIHIDEILMVGAFSKDTDKALDENHNREIYDNCFPTLNALKLPNTFVNLQDYSLLFDDPSNFSILQHEDWPARIGTHWSPHHFFWHDIHKHLGCKKPSSRIALILGCDKPFFDVTEMKGYFLDSGIIPYGRTNFNVKDNTSVINFYSHPDPQSANITMKQWSLLKNFFSEKKLSKYATSKIYTEVVNKMMYNLKHPIVYTGAKSLDHTFSKRDQFILKFKSPVVDAYLKGMMQIQNTKQVKNFSTSIFTRFYDVK